MPVGATACTTWRTLVVGRWHRRSSGPTSPAGFRDTLQQIRIPAGVNVMGDVAAKTAGADDPGLL